MSKRKRRVFTNDQKAAESSSLALSLGVISILNAHHRVVCSLYAPLCFRYLPTLNHNKKLNLARVLLLYLYVRCRIRFADKWRESH